MRKPSRDLIAVFILGALMVVSFILHLFAFNAQFRRDPWPVDASIFLYITWPSAFGVGIFALRHILRSRGNSRNRP